MNILIIIWQKLKNLKIHPRDIVVMSIVSINFLATIYGELADGIEGILNMIMCGVQSAAFYGAVFGLIFFGLLKIWEIFFPEAAGQTRNYIKSLVIGVIVISTAFWIVSTVFEALGMSVGNEVTCG